jgi:hypothetical protein
LAFRRQEKKVITILKSNKGKEYMNSNKNICVVINRLLAPFSAR